CEAVFARRKPGAASAHLLIKDRTVREARHHKITDLGAVEAGIQHIHADQDLGEFLSLKTLDLRRAVNAVFWSQSGNHEVGVTYGGARFLVGEFLVEHARKRFSMALSHGKNDGFAPIGRTADALRTSVAVFQNIAEFAHHGTIAFG